MVPMANTFNIPNELISKTISFDYKTPLVKVVPALSKYSAVIVKKNKNYHGIIDRTTLYRATALKVPKNANLPQMRRKFQTTHQLMM